MMGTSRGEPQPSPGDRAFLERMQAHRIAPTEFGHAAHLRLAYILLCEHGFEDARPALRAALQAFIAHHGVDPAKYHETITRAWLLAVDHFMRRAGPTASFEEFAQRSPRLLDPALMLSHYSRERLHSEEGRTRFVGPDRAPFPDRATP